MLFNTPNAGWRQSIHSLRLRAFCSKVVAKFRLGRGGRAGLAAWSSECRAVWIFLVQSHRKSATLFEVADRTLRTTTAPWTSRSVDARRSFVRSALAATSLST